MTAFPVLMKPVIAGKAARIGMTMGNLKQIILLSLFASFALYSGYIYSSGTETVAAAQPTREAQAGQHLFQEKNCIACHQFYGLGGYMGPDLTNVISEDGKGPAYARVFLEFGTSKMPDFDLDETEIDNLIAYLEFVDATGKYPYQNPRISWLGTVDYDAGQKDK